MRVAVLGAGSWGTAITGLVAPKVDDVFLWAREQEIVDGINATHINPVYLLNYKLNENVRATNSLEEAISNVDALIVASPSAYLRQTCKNAAPFVNSTCPVLILSKGIELASSKLMHEVAADELGNPTRIAALSGPNHAEEIAQGIVSAAAIASVQRDTAEYFQQLLISNTFRAYVQDDIIGIETCGAVKNIIAIACGIAYGLGAGDNTLAVLMTRGTAEMSRIVSSLGGDPITCMGLAGMGDLIVTCTSKHSRNRTFGEAFVAGDTLDAYQSRTHMVVEGAQAAHSVYKLAKKHSIEVPITAAVYSLLYKNAPLDEVVQLLSDRIPHDEFYGM